VAKLNQFLLTAKNCWYRSLLDMAAAIGLLVELHFWKIIHPRLVM